MISATLEYKGLFYCGWGLEPYVVYINLISTFSQSWSYLELGWSDQAGLQLLHLFS
jgi:hypothetical protein